jgi:hypothetical protein
LDLLNATNSSFLPARRPFPRSFSLLILICYLDGIGVDLTAVNLMWYWFIATWLGFNSTTVQGFIAHGRRGIYLQAAKPLAHIPINIDDPSGEINGIVNHNNDSSNDMTEPLNSQHTSATEMVSSSPQLYPVAMASPVVIDPSESLALSIGPAAYRAASGRGLYAQIV